jgi:hypothetical protein
MGMTYYCTDGAGFSYRRYSRAHSRPQYLFATIARAGHMAATTSPAPKSNVSYARNREVAVNTAARWTRIGFESEIVPVRALPGRHDGPEPRAVGGAA